MARKKQTRPVFVPRPGQVDMRQLYSQPVIGCVVVAPDGDILLVKRSQLVSYYQGKWSGPFGFLDDKMTPAEKARHEVGEEVGIKGDEVLSVGIGRTIDWSNEDGSRDFLIRPALVQVRTKKVHTNWEATDYRWVHPRQMFRFRKMVPNFRLVLESFNLA